MSLRFAVAAWSAGLLCLTPNMVHGQVVSLEGKTIEVGRQHGPSLQASGFVSTQVVVGPGVEVTNFGAFSIPQFPPSGVPGFVDVDISATSILITLTRNQTFSPVEQLRFNLSNIPPFFLGVTINPATDWAGFNEPIRAMAFGKDTFVNLASLTGLQGQKILLDLNMSNVPEPSGAALGGLALAGLGALRRRRRARGLAPRKSRRVGAAPTFSDCGPIHYQFGRDKIASGGVSRACLRPPCEMVGEALTLLDCRHWRDCRSTIQRNGG